MQRIVLAMLGIALITGLHPVGAAAQTVGGDQEPASAGVSEELEPLIPPGISDFSIELYGKQAYTWAMADGTQVIEVMGDFSARMGQYKLAANDAVIWFNRQQWQNRPYLDLEIFLWQGAEIIQPGGTTEKGPVLLVTLRTFGTLILNTDAHAAVDDSASDIFTEGLRARGLLNLAPPTEAVKAGAPVQVAPTLEKILAGQPKPPKIVAFSVGPEGQLHHEQHGEQSVIIAAGDVFVSQGSPAQSGEYLELHADAAVLYLRADKLGESLPGMLEQDQAKPIKKRKSGGKDDFESAPTEVSPPDTDLGKKDKLDRQAFREWVSAAYLEGDVVLMRGERMIRASKLYYDFEAERALILDVVMRALEPSKGLPIYVRAEQVRQLSPTEYEANKAQITTSEFHTPHVAIGAEKVYLTDRTPRNEKGDVIGVEAGTYKAYSTTLNVEGVPVAYWPLSQGDFSRDRMAFRSAKFGYESDFGAIFETRWYMFNLLGLQQPEGYDATLKLDYFTERGPGVGVDMDYKRDDYFGLLRSYYINDHGKDDLGSGPDVSPDTENRGRFLWRHRQLLGKGWELSLEGSYISDDQYMKAYERNEWENAKPPEDAIYLVKRQDNWQFSTLANWRLNDFLTETEHFPDAMFSLIGEPLGEYATFYSESRAGVVRYRPDDNFPREPSPNGPNPWNNPSRTGSVVRGDTREELQFPVPDLGPVKLTPFTSGRVTGWDDSPTPDSGGIARGFATYGVKGNTIVSKTNDSIDSEILDLHRLRHVVKTEGSLWNSHSNKDPDDLSPFDPGVETIDDFGGGTIGVRQRLQTQRGGPGKWRTVDWIVLDVEAGFFNDKQEGMRTLGDYISTRPEDSRSSNFLATNFQYRISDSTVVVYDGIYDTNRGNMGTSNISLAVEREPRMAYFVGWRYIHDTNNSLLGGGANYKLTEKHSVAIREFYDIEEGRNYSTELAYIRKWPRWYSSVAFDVDRTLDDWGVNFSIWPEGAPKLGLGSRRFTGLSDSVGISPE